MAALTTSRDTVENLSAARSKGDYLIADNVKIFQGALIVLDPALGTGGQAKPAVAAAGLVALGRSDATHDNTGPGHVAEKHSDTQKPWYVGVTGGDYWYENKAGDLVVVGDVDSDCYLEDDQTVRHTAAGTSRAGKVLAVDAELGVLVRIGIGL